MLVSNMICSAHHFHEFQGALQFREGPTRPGGFLLGLVGSWFKTSCKSSGSSMTSRAAVTIIDAGWTGAELAVVWGWMFFLLALLQCICWVGVRLWHLPRQPGEVAEAENVQPKTREEIGVQTADASPIQRRNKIPTSLKDFPEAKKAQATLAAIVSATWRATSKPSKREHSGGPATTEWAS